MPDIGLLSRSWSTASTSAHDPLGVRGRRGRRLEFGLLLSAAERRTRHSDRAGALLGGEAGPIARRQRRRCPGVFDNGATLTKT